MNRFDWNVNTKYLGAFRVPNYTLFDNNANGLCYDSTSKSLFITGKAIDSTGQKTAEISIPAPIVTDDITKLNRALLIQGFKEPTEGRYKEIFTEVPSPTQIGDYYVSGNDLFITMYPYYDANNKQIISHFKRSKNLGVSGVIGPYGLTFAGVGKPDRFVNSYFCDVPNSWREIFNSVAIVGGEPANISGGASNGPDAFLWNPSEFKSQQSVTPLLYYTVANALSPWDKKSDLWNGTTACAGVALLDNYRTFLVINHQGVGDFCYGDGYGNGPDGKPYNPSSKKCYDPTNFNHGGHAYPYKYVAIAYDAMDFVPVMNGTAKPWTVRPYTHWIFELPFAKEPHMLNGLAYDIAGKRLFIEQSNGDGLKPVIHVIGLI